MFLRKKRLNKENPQNKTKILFVFLFFLIFISTLFLFIYYKYYLGAYAFISPLSLNKNIFAVRIEKGFEKFKIDYIHITSNTDGSIKVTISDGSEVIFSPKKDLSPQIASLQLMLSRLTIEGKKLKSLDFRFNNPVVSFY